MPTPSVVVLLDAGGVQAFKKVLPDFLKKNLHFLKGFSRELSDTKPPGGALLASGLVTLRYGCRTLIDR